jgi:hypothetical protein
MVVNIYQPTQKPCLPREPVEVPVLIGLVYVSLWARKFLFRHDGTKKAL